jgi:hypothetical protein
MISLYFYFSNGLAYFRGLNINNKLVSNLYFNVPQDKLTLLKVSVVEMGKYLQQAQMTATILPICLGVTYTCTSVFAIKI